MKNAAGLCTDTEAAERSAGTGICGHQSDRTDGQCGDLMNAAADFQKGTAQDRECVRERQQLHHPNQDGKQNNIAAQSRDCGEAVHDTGIQHRKLHPARGCLFFICCIRKREMIKGTRADAVQKGHGIEENTERPWHFRIAQLFQTNVIDKKTGTDIVTEAKEIGTLFFGNMLLPDQIRSDLCTHGKPAQKAHKNCVAAVFRDVEDSVKKRRVEPVQIPEQPGLYHQG